MKGAAILSRQMTRGPVLMLGINMMMIWSRAVQFQHGAFKTADDIADITFVRQGGWYTGQNASYNGSAIWLTTAGLDAISEPGRIGRIVYKDPVRFDVNASFSTSFTFQIITTAPYGVCGSGMAFFISTSLQAPQNSDNQGALGLVDPTLSSSSSDHFFAVEFDTHVSPLYHDPSASHVGININSMISSNLTDTSSASSDLYLYNNYTFAAWVEYDASDSLIQVWMANISSESIARKDSSTSIQRPQLPPSVQFTYDLSAIFQKSPMYVGFSATDAPSTQGVEGHAIYSWNFSNENPSRCVGAAGNCAPGSRHSVKANNNKLLLFVLAPTSAAIAVAVALTIIIAKMKKRRQRSDFRPISRRHDHNNPNIEMALNAVRRYSFKELRKAAHGFDEKQKVGEGGFSIVYRGTLADGSAVAVKRLKEGVRKEAEFRSEIGIISGIRHRNLLQLQGWCYERGEALLVYKYMCNGSLEGHLFDKQKYREALNGDTRLRILEDVAAGLEYLHGGLGRCVLHRDVKAGNVLLTEEYEAMLSDFGLARLISHGAGAVTMTAAGTPGRIAPEVVYTGRATEKADVYSFGILALEVATGRRAVEEEEQAEEEEEEEEEEEASEGATHGRRRVRDLLAWVWRLHQTDRLVEALDPAIINSSNYYIEADEEVAAGTMTRAWMCVLHVALLCCHPLPESRPTMRRVSHTLRDRVLLPLPAARPAYPYTTGVVPKSSTSGTSDASSSIVTSSSQYDPPLSEELPSPR